MDILLKYFDDFTPAQLEQFKALEDLYTDWNEKINVISRKDIGSLYERHVLHSLGIAALFNFKPGMQIVDLGAGGGFPGLPLAIFFPETEFLLVDSIGKKLKVVDGVAEAIGLKNIQTRHSRIEEVKNRQFDFVVSRAVAPLKSLWQWSKPLIKKNTEKHVPSLIEKGDHAPGLICLKGGDLAQEISESGTRPHVLPLTELFTEPFFEEKYLVYVPK
ncbi:MAG: 16S rRNA (guanine(527)-N(7))-methyltransferase RsmG [Niabella sp.]|nr:16S rRNA (guanine(527)-N(7))-methyltransferase RsmG [Niabella sp.]